MQFRFIATPGSTEPRTKDVPNPTISFLPGYDRSWERQAMSIMCRCATGKMVHAVRSAFRSAVGAFTLFALGSSGARLCAQPVAIRLVNGKTGRAVSDTCVNVWVGRERKEAMSIPTDKDGVASLRLTDNDGQVDLHADGTRCGYFGVASPVVKLSDSLRINVGFVLCQPHGTDYSWLAVSRFSTKQLLQQGIVTPNTCGKATASPKPGELIIFVRQLRWWEKVKE